MHLIHCKDPEEKLGTAGQFLYDLNCFLDARKRGFDVLLQLGYTSSSVWWWLWPKDCPNVVNMDGLEWKRSKYSPKVQRFLKWAEGLAVRHADKLIADSVGIQEHLQKAFGKSSVFIPYGAEVLENSNEKILAAYGLQPYKYSLLIARMEPENNIETILDGYVLSGNENSFVVVGKTENDFGKKMVAKFSGHRGIRFLGGIYDFAVIDNLRHFAGRYFHGHSVGGTILRFWKRWLAARSSLHTTMFLTAQYWAKMRCISPVQMMFRLCFKYLFLPKSARKWTAANLAKIRTTYNWPAINDTYEKRWWKPLRRSGGSNSVFTSCRNQPAFPTNPFVPPSNRHARHRQPSYFSSSAVLLSSESETPKH